MGERRPEVPGVMVAVLEAVAAPAMTQSVAIRRRPRRHQPEAVEQQIGEAHQLQRRPHERRRHHVIYKERPVVRQEDAAPTASTTKTGGIGGKGVVAGDDIRETFDRVGNSRLCLHPIDVVSRVVPINWRDELWRQIGPNKNYIRSCRPSGQFYQRAFV